MDNIKAKALFTNEDGTKSCCVTFFDTGSGFDVKIKFTPERDENNSEELYQKIAYAFIMKLRS